MSARRTSSATAKTGSSGCCATAIRSSAGSTAVSRCSAMPRIRCCNISRKAPARRWRTRCACRTCCRTITITPSRSSTTAPSASRAPRACSCYPAPSASTSITRRATTPASATPSWARRARRIITAIWRGCMAGRDWRATNPRRPGQAKREPGPIATGIRVRHDGATASRNNGHWWLWVPAFAGTTSNMLPRQRYIFISACRSILPVPVFGNSSMKMISRGYLYGSNFALT